MTEHVGPAYSADRGSAAGAATARPPAVPPVAWPGVAAIAVAVVAVQLALAGRYDYHRDELYFRMLGEHPAWGYVDQPPLTPLLARAGIALLGDNLWAVRLFPALCLGATAVLLALLAREAGGGRAAQLLAAGGGFAGFLLIAGHTLLTASPDLPVWALVILFVMRALLRDRPRYWLAAGAVVGLGLYNKHLVILLLVGLAGGLLLVGPRRPLRSGWLWAGVALAVAVGSPNLVYQIANDFPQFQMAGALADNKGDEARVMLVPMQFILLGLPIAPVIVAGLVALLRRPQLRPVRALAVAYPLVVVLLFLTAGQPYYTIGLLAVLYAVGCVPAVGWAARGRLRSATLAVALGVNVALSAVLMLPVLPVGVLGDTPIPEINQVTRDQIGWPAYVRQVAAGYAALPAEDRAHAVVITGNYGEAGAVDRYGGRYGLPAVHSGQNELYRLGPPPESATAAVVVLQGEGAGAFLTEIFTQCDIVARLDNGVGVENEEQGTPVRACRGRRGSWSRAWPRFRHLD